MKGLHPALKCPSTRPHQKQDLLPRRHLRHRMPSRRHRQAIKGTSSRSTPPVCSGATPLQSHFQTSTTWGLQQHPSLGGEVNGLHRCGCNTSAVHPSTRKGISTNTPHIGNAPTVKMRYPSKGACVDVESGTEERTAHQPRASC